MNEPDKRLASFARLLKKRGKPDLDELRVSLAVWRDGRLGDALWLAYELSRDGDGMIEC